MFHRSLFSVFIVVFGCFSFVQGQFVSGIVQDETGDPIPFVSIYIEGTSTGTSSNVDGQFKLELPSVQGTLVFQHIAFEKQLYDLSEVEGDMLIIMRQQQVELAQVVIEGSEDPAYAIMRKAIEKRKFHLKQVDAYSCRAYVKGMQQLTAAPEQILGQTIDIQTADSNSTGIVYLSESESVLHFKQPDKIKETIISSKVSGEEQGFSWNQASDFQLNFYENKIDPGFISDRPFISPVAENAMFFYDYKLLGVFTDGQKLINRIAVSPRRSNDPSFTGILNIVDDSWNIHSLDLFLTKQQQIYFLDTINFIQQFVPISGSIWMPINQQFDFYVNVFGFEGRGYYLGVFSEYELNPQFPKGFFNNEILNFQNSAAERDTSYWDSIRPVPLSSIEARDYIEKDSIRIVHESEAYLDSTDKKNNKYKVSNLLLGYTYDRSYKNISVTFPSLLNIFTYNLVEGFTLLYDMRFRKEFENNSILSIEPHIRYGFSNTHFNAHVKLNYLSSLKHWERFSFAGGKKVQQFDSNDPIPALIDMEYILFAKYNYMKIYEKWYASIEYRREILNGVTLWTTLEYERRLPLKNTTDFTFASKKDREFTPNVPDISGDDVIPFQGHDALTLDVRIRLRLGQKYLNRPDMKVNLGGKWPEFNAYLKTSIPAGGYDGSKFMFAQIDINDDIPLGLFGVFQFRISGGGFFNNSSVQMPDHKHFQGNRTYWAQEYMTGFQQLEYYKYSTDEWFATVHLEHHFKGFLLNKIPVIRKSRFHVVASGRFLYNPALKGYWEYGIGFENILRVFRIEFVGSASPYVDNRYGVRIGSSINVFN